MMPLMCSALPLPEMVKLVKRANDLGAMTRRAIA